MKKVGSIEQNRNIQKNGNDGIRRLENQYQFSNFEYSGLKDFRTLDIN